MRRKKGPPPERPRIGVSACLLGQRVRYDGGHKRDAFLVEVLGRRVEWVPVCPELELGLGVPREPIRLEGDGGAPRLVAPGSRTDHTAAMRAFARARVAALAAEDLSGYVLKSDSPSCGMARVPVWERRGHPTRRGVGAFARVLMKRLPLLPVEEEGRLQDARVRDRFVERIFAYARWKRLLAAGATRPRLVAFHRAHERLLLAHDPRACRRLDRLVAGSGARLSARELAAYGRGFTAVLRARRARR